MRSRNSSAADFAFATGDFSAAGAVVVVAAAMFTSLGESLNPFEAEPPVLLPCEAKLLPKFLGVARKAKELPPFSFSEIAAEGVEDETDTVSYTHLTLPTKA